MKVDISTMKQSARLFFHKNGPGIMVVGGVIGLIGSGVMACIATRKVDDVIVRNKNRIEAIHKTVPAEEQKKELTLGYLHAGLDFAALYGPSIVLGALSATSVLVGHDILKKRNLRLAVAYMTLDQGYRQYRNRVIERYGEEVDQELRFGTHKEKIEETVTDEKGKEKKVKKEVQVYDEDISGYAKWFTLEESEIAEQNIDYNLMILKGIQTSVNIDLRTRGYLFLNDVYSALGYKRTKAGQVVGWVYDKNREDHGDNWIDFGIRKVRKLKNDGSGLTEEAILLDFNVDGPIMDHLYENRLIEEF